MLSLQRGYGCPEPFFTKRGLAKMLVPDDVLKCCVFLGVMKNG